MHKLIAIAITLLLFSCSHKVDEKRAAVLSMEGMEIVIPDSLVFTVQGVSVEITNDNHDYRILTYIDTKDCTPCKMRLSDWNQVIDKYKRTDEVDVDFLMVVNAPSSHELDSVIKAENFRNPICFDSAGVFIRRNSIPDKFSYQTFLLDSDNNILLTGNPTVNPKIEDLYDEVIYEDTRLNFTHFCGKPTDCFGTAAIGDTVTSKFILHNSTDQPLTIKKIVTSCNCVSAVASADAIQSAKDIAVTVNIVADEIGETRKYADVYFNEQENPERLTLYGYVLTNPNHSLKKQFK